MHFGAGRHDTVLNPWDVSDPAQVPASKAEFLLALHTLLIGDHTDSQHRALAGLERTLLARGITAVYARCAETGERPRERLLYEELRRLAREQAADTQRRRRHRRVGIPAPGRAAAPLHRRRPVRRGSPTSRPPLQAGSPLLLFDLAGLPDALAGPVMLTLVDFIDRDVQRRRARHLAHPRRTRRARGRAGRSSRSTRPGSPC